MADRARQVAGAGPSAIAIHDDRDMTRWRQNQGLVLQSIDLRACQ
jgi:hypothetical protein